MPEPHDITILVVDDNEMKRYSVVRVLRQAGFRTMEASTGEEALCLAAKSPDLMVLDVKLPGISGFDVCRHVKADPNMAGIKILHVSATFIDSDHRVEGLAHGADGYLVQPVEPNELVETIRALLRLREAEETARRTAREWRATFDALSSAILLVDDGGTVLRCNRAMAEISGKPFHDIVGAPYQEAIPAPLAAVVSPTLSNPLHPVLVDSPEVSLEDREFLVTVNRVMDDHDNLTGAVCVFSDITERKRLEEELRLRAEALVQADRAKDEFLAMLGHELRNPLGAISNALEVMRLREQQELAGGPVTVNTDRAREILVRQVATMKRLVDDLLDVSRVTSGKVSLRKEPLSMEEVVAGALRNLQPQITAKGLQLRFEAQQAHVMGDRVRLEQVVTNLLTNAIRYTDEGTIHVKLQRSEQGVVLKVRDTGIGIRAEMLPMVFDMFSQGEREVFRSQGGLGVGLTLVQGLVELHGGTVEAASEGEGLGSTFTVTLPPLEGAPASSETIPPDGAAAGGRHILIVDDNMDAAMTIADILETWGHTTVTAFDGPSALEAVGRHRPDVVLLDIGLPGMNGYEVVRRLRDTTNGRDLVLVAVTGYGQTEDHQRAVAAGFDYHLAKPINLPALQKILAGKVDLS